MIKSAGEAFGKWGVGFYFLLSCRDHHIEFQLLVFAAPCAQDYSPCQKHRYDRTFYFEDNGRGTNRTWGRRNGSAPVKRWRRWKPTERWPEKLWEVVRSLDSEVAARPCPTQVGRMLSATDGSRRNVSMGQCSLSVERDFYEGWVGDSAVMWKHPRQA